MNHFDQICRLSVRAHITALFLSIHNDQASNTQNPEISTTSHFEHILIPVFISLSSIITAVTA